MNDRARFVLEYEAEPSTLQSYNNQLRYLEDWLLKNKVTRLTLAEYKHFLDAKGWGNSTRRLNLCALKAFIRWLKIDHPILDFSIPKKDPGPQRTLKPKQRDELLKACNGKFALRDKAIIWVLWDTFIRKFELCGALIDHLDLDYKILFVETKAHPMRGRQWEEKRFGPQTKKALKAWFEVRHAFAKPGVNSIFVSNTGLELTPDGVSCIFKRLTARVGFTVGTHDFRRGGATHANKKAGSRYVMQQGGWKSADVFLSYTREAELEEYAKQMWGDDD